MKRLLVLCLLVFLFAEPSFGYAITAREYYGRGGFKQKEGATRSSFRRLDRRLPEGKDRRLPLRPVKKAESRDAEIQQLRAEIKLLIERLDRMVKENEVEELPEPK